MDWNLWLVVLGLALGTLGTLIGAGGGFILVPVLLLIYPHEDPKIITSISLAVVFFNATSGSIAYAKLRRIDYKSGILFAIATVPGAIAGALTTDLIPRRAFNGVFGILMLIAAIYLILNHNKKEQPIMANQKKNLTIRTIIEKSGTTHTFAYNLNLGMWLSVFVGYLSSLLGIGGGIIHVPVLSHMLNFPVHIATATSHFVLAIMAFTGTLVHIATGSFSQSSIQQTLLIGTGVLFGAQAGAWLSGRMRGGWIIRSLAVALGLVGVRILFMALRS